MTAMTRGLALIATALSLSTAAAAQDVTFRLSHWLPPQHPIAAQGLESWAKAITEESGGTIKFQIFPAAQIGKAEDHYDLARDGVADVAWLNPGFNAGRFPGFAAVQIPLTVADGMKGIEALNEWYAPIAKTEMADVHFCLGHMLSPLTFHMKSKQILHPTDLSGLKLRPSSAMEAAYMREFGATTVQGSNPEAREMIARGIIDGTTGTNGSSFVFGVDQVTNYDLNVPFSAVSFALVINKDRYEALNADQKKVIDNNCNGAAALKFFGPVQTFEDEGLTKLKALGGDHKVVDPAPEVLAEWIAGTASVRDSWEKEAAAKGLNPDEVLGSLREIFDKHGALLK